MNSSEIQRLEPQALWTRFVELNAIPRASKKEQRAVAFVKEFGERLGLETLQDAVGNVIIRKPATAGMEGRAPIVMQGHLDMVHQKNAGTDFDFDTQGIDMLVDGDWVKARGTTLGADNGIGVAATLAVLASEDIPHPAIEALFTVNEENGMTGALGLEGGLLSGRFLLNLDTEDDTELTIGCAGAVNVSARGSYSQEPCRAQETSYRIGVRGLTGGHSGMDIHLGRANANKLLARLLLAAEPLDVRIASIDAGGLRNAIPREGFALVTIDRERAGDFEALVAAEANALAVEYAATDPKFELVLEPCDRPESRLGADFQATLLRAIRACPSGIHRLSPAIPDLVQSSNNLARVWVENGHYETLCLTRGSVDSEKMDLARTVGGAFELAGAEIEYSGAYPGWAPQPDSDIVRLMSALYEEVFGRQPDVKACHAGLECGIIGQNYPAMQMISFGPNIRGAHSPDERVQVSSVQKFWGYLMEALKRIPAP